MNLLLLYPIVEPAIAVPYCMSLLLLYPTVEPAIAVPYCMNLLLLYTTVEPFQFQRGLYHHFAVALYVDNGLLIDMISC